MAKFTDLIQMMPTEEQRAPVLVSEVTHVS